jgi:hypothetical protein
MALMGRFCSFICDRAHYRSNSVGKRRLNFASFTIKERLNFPIATHYHVDIIAHASFLAGKFNAVWWQILKAVFQLCLLVGRTRMDEPFRALV